ncbi:hypothetical protein [Sphingobacterium daejeonense]|nr:hypothetical protein [Sphingobacterium daejeonense]VTP92950.1 Uncharacterised protein [Sphingobacterium daejeonense]
MLEDKKFRNTWIWIIVLILSLVIVYFIWQFLFSSVAEVSEEFPK